jgi:hypothetical protein
MAQTWFGMNRNSTAKWWSRLTFGLSLRVCLRLPAFHCQKIQQRRCIQAEFKPLLAGLRRPLERDFRVGIVFPRLQMRIADESFELRGKQMIS